MTRHPSRGSIDIPYLAESTCVSVQLHPAKPTTKAQIKHHKQSPTMADSSKVPVSETTSYADPTVQNSLNAALIMNGSIPVIQNKLLYELQASKWTANLRDFVTNLMRSGECLKYDEIMDRVLQEANKSAGPSAATKSGAGNGRSVADSLLAIPEAAVLECVKTIKEELEKVTHVTDEP